MPRKGKVHQSDQRDYSCSQNWWWRSGGNPRLRAAIQAAKAANMPADNVKRAIQKGTGELPGVTYEEIHYEGYGPGGMAILVEVLLTIKIGPYLICDMYFPAHNGNMGEAGSVSWMFTKKGSIVVEKSAVDEEKLMEDCN